MRDAENMQNEKLSLLGDSDALALKGVHFLERSEVCLFSSRRQPWFKGVRARPVGELMAFDLALEGMVARIPIDNDGKSTNDAEVIVRDG